LIFLCPSPKSSAVSHSICWHSDPKTTFPTISTSTTSWFYPLSLYFQFPQLSSGLGSKFFGRRYETIATPFQSFYVTGFFSGIPKGFSQLTQRGVQTIIEIYKCVNRPEPLAQALAAYQLATLLQKGNQNLEGLVLQTNSSAVSSQFACFQGNFKRTKPVPT